jgi:sugar lactone lactonase YvrE
VLVYKPGSTTATRVFGQLGNFTSNVINLGGVRSHSLYEPIAIAVDGNGNVYISDYANNRVLYYSSGSTSAIRVYGQLGSFTSNTANLGGVSENSLNHPIGVALDPSDNLYISDRLNSRILFFPANSTTATRVYGQSGSFVGNSQNYLGIGPNSLNYPEHLTVDTAGSLFVADYQNNRVLMYRPGETSASTVYGQQGSFVTATANLGGIGPTSLFTPCGVVVDGTGNVYISDESNHRVLYFPSGSTTATRVLGQLGLFTTNVLNQPGGAVSENSLYYPAGLSIDNSGSLYLADGNNNRVLYYPAGSSTAHRVYGQM